MEHLNVYIWLGLILLLIIIEAATVSLTTIWFAAGSLVALLLTLINAPLWVQLLAFLLVSLVLLIFTRPVAVKYLQVGSQKTNTDAIIGSKGIVLVDISEHAAGQVKLKGVVWTAISKNGETILKDREVIVEGIEGVKLIVSPS
jgi:membrane protein implicated in regulation of membrane protease activity